MAGRTGITVVRMAQAMWQGEEERAPNPIIEIVLCLPVRRATAMERGGVGER
jgi:hypothetical protein